MDSSAAAAAAGASLPFASINGKIALLALGSEEEEGDEGVDLAAEFVKRGCRVVLVGCPIARVTEACDQVRSRASSEASESRSGLRGGGADFVRAVELDATRGEQAVEGAVEEAWGAFGGVDIVLSYTSAFGALRPVLETTGSEFDETMALNVKAVWLVSKCVARKMQQARRAGSVLFLTSIAGTERGIFPGVSVYGTSMAALNHLTKMMAMELGKYGIRVNAIACGLAEPSALVLEGGDRGKGGKSSQMLAKRVVPLQRWLQFPSDVTGVMLWLASDSSTFITGTITVVDGGLSLRRPRLGEYRSRL